MSAYHEPSAKRARDPLAVVTDCIESGAGGLLLDGPALPRPFFDLSSGFAGELLHKAGLYGIRVAIVVADPSAHSARFRDFVREARGRSDLGVFATRDAALDWLLAAG